MRLTILRLADFGIQNQMKAAMLRPWKDAATIMITAPPANETLPVSGPIKSKSLPTFLLTTRSKKSSFLPGGLCFPGGAQCSEDASPEWASYFLSNLGEDINKASFMPSEQMNPIPLYIKSLEERKQTMISKEVSLRISAIRETFEECGILLCKPITHEGFKPGIGRTSKSGVGGVVRVMELDNKAAIKEWQQRVKHDPASFEDLCSTFKCYPDVNGLTEWNNWLTPCINTLPKRFDTIFYTAVLPKQCKLHIDSQEISDAQVSTSFA